MHWQKTSGLANQSSPTLTTPKCIKYQKISYIYLFAFVREDLNRMAQQIHLQFAQVANEAGEDALQSMGMSLNDFRGSIEKYSGDPEVGRTLTMLQMQQQQELMAMGVPSM